VVPRQPFTSIEMKENQWSAATTVSCTRGSRRRAKEGVGGGERGRFDRNDELGGCCHARKTGVREGGGGGRRTSALVRLSMRDCPEDI